jgi:hypothetical protein
MEFETRSKEAVLADLTQKLETLPINHPDHAILTRMIHDLGREIDKSPDPIAAMPR